jgi:hypothetical protein
MSREREPSEAEGGGGASAVPRIKGAAIVEIVKALRHYKERGRAATPSELQHYLGSHVLPSSLYPEADYLGLLRALAEVLVEAGDTPRLRSGAPLPAAHGVWEVLGHNGAYDYYDGVYRRLFRDADPMATLKNYPVLWRVRHEVGTVTVEERGAARAEVTLEDYPFAAADWCRTMTGMIWGLLELAGAEGIEVTKRQCKAGGDAICAWDVSWASS